MFHTVTPERSSFRENPTFFSPYTRHWIHGIVCGAIHGSWSEMSGNRLTDRQTHTTTTVTHVHRTLKMGTSLWSTLFNYYVCVSVPVCASSSMYTFPPPSLSFYSSPFFSSLLTFRPSLLPLPLPPSILTDLSETGRMLSTALRDGYLTMHDTHSDLSPHHHQLSASLDGRHFGQALNDTLFPPLTQNDRHPSAPQLVSMLTDNKADVMLQDDVVGPL